MFTMKVNRYIYFMMYYNVAKILPLKNCGLPNIKCMKVELLYDLLG